MELLNDLFESKVDKTGFVSLLRFIRRESVTSEQTNASTSGEHPANASSPNAPLTKDKWLLL
jgi:hypothetical protein